MLSGLCGCAIVPSLNLTEEQSTLIAEYAAGKLIEYAKGHPGGLITRVDDIDFTEVNPGLKKEEEPIPEPILPGQMPTPQDGPEVPEENAPAPDGPGAPDESTQEALVEAPEDAAQTSTESLAKVLGMNGPVLSYDYYEIAQHYPDNDAELAFSMKAAPGKDLLIVHFLLTNPGDSDVNVHTDSSDFKVRLLVNGSDKLRGDVTFLDNDLMNYDGVLTPGAQVDAVFVFEVAQDTEVESMELIILGDDGEQKYKVL